jgi:hypothetical protein
MRAILPAPSYTTAMDRPAFSLRFLLLWLVPYVAISAVILTVGQHGESSKPARDFSWGARCTLFAAITCSWLTTVGVLWVIRHSPQPELPPRVT